jgi:ATP dependent DNA ligase-like protein
MGHRERMPTILSTACFALRPVEYLSATASPLSPADLCHPMITRAPFTREGWINRDGFRAFVRKHGTCVQLFSRRGRSMSAALTEVVDALATLPGDVVLDSELVVPDHEGRRDFEALRRRSLMRRPLEDDERHCDRSGQRD